MTILLVPPIGAAGSNVVFACLLFLFSFFPSYADSPWFSFYLFLSSFFRLISRMEVVRRELMTNLLCLSRIVWRQGAGHSWRTQGGAGSLGSKVPGGLAGRTWLYYAYHTLLPLPGGCFGLLSACYFPFLCHFSPGSSSYSVYNAVVVWWFCYFSFFPARPFSSVCHL